MSLEPLFKDVNHLCGPEGLWQAEVLFPMDSGLYLEIPDLTCILMTLLLKSKYFYIRSDPSNVKSLDAQRCSSLQISLLGASIWRVFACWLPSFSSFLPLPPPPSLSKCQSWEQDGAPRINNQLYLFNPILIDIIIVNVSQKAICLVPRAKIIKMQNSTFTTLIK